MSINSDANINCDWSFIYALIYLRCLMSGNKTNGMRIRNTVLFFPMVIWFVSYDEAQCFYSSVFNKD